MKRTTFDHQNKLTLTVRTERGTVALDVGLEWLEAARPRPPDSGAG